MKKNVLNICATVCIAVLLLPGIVFSQSGINSYGRQAGAYPGQYGQMFINPELGLTTDQMVQRNRIWSEFQNDTIQLRTDIYNKQMQINALINTETPDIEKIRKLQNELNIIQGEFNQKRIDKTVKTRNILTTQQKAVYSQCYGRGQSGMTGFKGRGHRGGVARSSAGPGCVMW